MSYVKLCAHEKYTDAIVIHLLIFIVAATACASVCSSISVISTDSCNKSIVPQWVLQLKCSVLVIAL